MRLFLATLLLAAAAATGAADPGEGKRFNTWLDAYWEEALVREPIRATFVGDPRYNDRVVDFTTAAWRDDNRRNLERRLKELGGFNRQALTGQDRLSYDVLRRDLEERLEGERFPDWMQPLNQGRNIMAFVAMLGSGDSVQPFRTTKDYDDWYQRLSGTVPLMDGMIANMRIGLSKGVMQPKPIMEKVLPQIAALIVTDPEQSQFWKPMQKFPDTVSAADRERLTAAYRTLIRDRVMPAYQRMHDFLRDEYLPQARTSTAWSDLPDGKAWYAFRVKNDTTTGMTPEAIHALGLQEVARILGEMDAVRREVKFKGDLKAFFQHLKDDPGYYYSRPEEIIAGYLDLQKQINGLLPKLFDIMPKADYVVRAVEPFRARSAAAASYWSASADGSRPGVFYINTFDLKAQPKYRMEALSLHEASPGHHFQNAIAQEMTSLPKFRRFGASYVAYSEGWGLYAESLGRELGLYTDPYQRFGYLSAEQLRAMRLVVDTGLHHKGWTRQQSIEYMLANSSLAESDVIAEVERYIANPGQALGYKIGQLEISRLRREAEAALGPKFDVRKFHRLVLTSGQLPMDVLAIQVREWIAAEKAQG